LRSTAVQLEGLLLPWQLTVPDAQFAVAVHWDFVIEPGRGRLAAGTGAGAGSVVACGLP